MSPTQAPPRVPRKQFTSTQNQTYQQKPSFPPPSASHQIHNPFHTFQSPPSPIVPNSQFPLGPPYGSKLAKIEIQFYKETNHTGGSSNGCEKQRRIQPKFPFVHHVTKQ